MNYKQCYHKESRKPNKMGDEMGAEVGALKHPLFGYPLVI